MLSGLRLYHTYKFLIFKLMLIDTQGDFIAKGRSLPAMEAGDHLIMHDTGGYTYSLYSRFNSIQAPAIYGYEKSENGYRFVQFKSREKLEETLAFWGTHEPKEV